MKKEEEEEGWGWRIKQPMMTSVSPAGTTVIAHVCTCCVNTVQTPRRCLATFGM